MNTVVITIISLSVIGGLSGFILFLIAQKFKVFEDPRIDDVEAVLPGANCGGCGYPGCRGFAENCVKAESLDTLFCPVGGNDGMVKVAEALGKVAATKDPTVAVIRCSGSPDHRTRTTRYDSAATCEIASGLFSGDTACSYGCLGLGDCVVVCTFDAIHMNPVTLLPEVIDEKCTSCGACVKACPKTIIELRKKSKKDRKIFVSCVNQDKGAVAKKACSVACIGCKACVKECQFDAITIANFLAYIDPVKCTLCRKCMAVCPTDSILEINFPPRKVTEVESVVSEIQAN
ncbi:MAG: Fe-S cluster domain-containing protein [Bacteroidales bacterium]